MQTGTLLHILSAYLFSMGLLALILRRNTIVMLMGIELMLNAVNLSFVTFARELQQLDGQVQVFFIITIAAAESAVGLSILINVYRNFGSIKTDRTT
ncbi:MAG: NADH-quinone oxidoreductase subunit NuoK, partial [Proteobacteria bacterium]